MYQNLVSVLIEWGYDLTKDVYALSEGERAMYDDFAAKYSYQGEQDFYVVLQNIYFNEF